ncbi:36382_t:CDS:2, partial [Racocetra persica]
YLCWKTEKEQNKLTNYIDDILQLIESGKQQFCSGEGGCQRHCGRIGKCVEICNHYSNEQTLKNPLDMHKCSVRIITKVILSEVDTDYPVHLIIEGNHVPQNVI